MARLSALQELVELVPPPVAPQGAPFDWPAAESALGTALPSDFKGFCDVYGHGTFFNGWLWAPHTPHAPSGDDDLLSSYWLDILADVETVYRPYPEPGGVLCWCPDSDIVVKRAFNAWSCRLRSRQDTSSALDARLDRGERFDVSGHTTVSCRACRVCGIPTMRWQPTTPPTSKRARTPRSTKRPGCVPCFRR